MNLLINDMLGGFPEGSCDHKEKLMIIDTASSL